MKRVVLFGWLIFLIFWNNALIGQVTRTWTANLPNPKQWNTPANWSPNGSPLNTWLLFTGAGSSTQSNNDIIGGSFRSLVFTGASSYNITGNPIYLSDNSSQNFGKINNGSNVNQTISALVGFNDINNFSTVSTSGTAGTLSLAGGIDLGVNITALRLFCEYNTSPISISGSIIGSKQITIGLNDSNLLKANSRVVLQGNNLLFDGALSVQAGTLVLASSNASGVSASKGIEVYNNAALELSGGINVSGKDLYIQGNGINNGGAIRNVSGVNTISSRIIINGGARIQNVAGVVMNIGDVLQNSAEPGNLVFFGNSVIVNGIIGNMVGESPFGFLQNNTGSLTLTKVCNYTGETRAVSGEIVLGGNNVLPSTSLFHFNGTVSATLNTGGGYSQSLAGLKISGVNNQAYIKLAPGINHTLTFGNSRNEIWQSTKGLIINNWSGTPGVGANVNSGKIFVTPQDLSTPGLTDAQLSKITFAGFCEGAMLLPSGELVPSNLPFIRTVSSDPPGGSNNKNFGYVGSEIIINGCRLNEVTQLTIGATVVTPFALQTLSASNHNIVFNLGENVRGSIHLTTAAGTYTYGQSFENIGYLTADSGLNWTNNFTWRKPTATPVFPLADNSVTIGHNSVIISSVANPVNSLPSGTNKLIIRSLGISGIGAKGSNPALRLAGDQLVNINTPVEVFNGSLRTFNGNNNSNFGAINGNNQEFNSLHLSGNFNIALGKGSHVLRFAPSNHLTWNASSKIFIHNWEGNLGESGMAGKIYFGNSDISLTPQQILQIQFVGTTCTGTKILPTGELVPTDAPFITSVLGNPGSSFKGYIGSTVTINGCHMGDVTEISVGGVDAPITAQSANEVSFIISEDMPSDTILLKTVDINLSGKSPGRLINLGYISKAAGIWSASSTWLGDHVPLPGKNVTINNNVSLTSNILTGQMPDTLSVTNAGNLIFDAGRIIEIGSTILSAGTIDMTLGGEISFNELKSGLFSNTGDFISGIGTVIFKSSATISGNATTFYNLTINSGVVTLPSNSSQLPRIEGILTIKGGSFFQQNQLGPVYLNGSSLVYSIGSAYTRGVEWNSSGVALNSSPGSPRVIYIDNDTHLYLEDFPVVQPVFVSTSLQLWGNLIISNGKITSNMDRPLEIRGNLQLGIDPSSQSEIIMNSDLYLHGDFIKYYNSLFSFVGNAKVFLVGNKNAIIEERGFPVKSNPDNIIFPTLIVSKNAEITLESSIRVTDSMAFNLGIIFSKPGKYLLIDNNCLVDGGSIVSFVDGPMKKQFGVGSTDFEFKIGKVLPTTVYKPVSIGDFQPDGITTFSAEYFFTSTIESPNFSGPFFIDPSLTGIWANDWWDIIRTGNGKARVGIHYMPVPNSSWEPTAPCSNCNVGVVHYNSVSTSWEFTKSSGNFNNSTPPYYEAILHSSTGLVYSDVETSFSPFTIGFSFPGVLPIKLINFSAQLQNGDGLIKWQVADVNMVKFFELEHSSDGIRFQKLSTISTSENNAFQYLDKKLSSGIHYYRLKMFEKNGRFTYSRIEWIQVGIEQTIISGLLQNPVGGGKAIVKLYSATTQTADAIVVDRSGRVMLRQAVTIQKGNNQVNVSVFPLSSGAYFLKLRTMDGVEKVMPFLK